MSIRNSIADNIVSVLENATDPQFVFVSRAPIDPGQLSNAQFPCVYVETLDESREDDTMGMSSGTTERQSTLNVGVNCYVKTSSEMMDITRNDVIERVEEVLDADRTRGGQRAGYDPLWHPRERTAVNAGAVFSGGGPRHRMGRHRCRRPADHPA